MKRSPMIYIAAAFAAVLVALNIFIAVKSIQPKEKPTDEYTPEAASSADAHIVSDEQFTPPPVVISQSVKKVYVNDSYRLRVLSGAEVSWESSDPSIVSVDGNGVVKALRSGEAVITATDADGNSDRCTVNAQKVAYLTIDDNPTKSMTPKFIKLFDKYDMKVTLFFCAQPGNKPWYQDFYAAGHTLAIHGYSHNEGKIYYSSEAFIENVDAEREFLLGCTKAEYIPNILRFPTGSGEHKELRQKMIDMGYRVFDWTTLFQDSYLDSADACYDAVMSGVDSDCEIVLMHHMKASYDALPRFIDKMHELGYEFAPITEETAMWYF